MGKHVRWTMWNLLVKFSQPKVPKMEHLDTYLFWGKMAFVSMISGNSASTILPYFLKLLSVYIYIFWEGKSTMSGNIPLIPTQIPF